jgi:hypothetical protein
MTTQEQKCSQVQKKGGEKSPSSEHSRYPEKYNLSSDPAKTSEKLSRLVISMGTHGVAVWICGYPYFQTKPRLVVS